MNVNEMTDGVGVDATMECVGTDQSMTTAIGIARPGSMVGYVGVPHGVELPIQTMFYRNLAGLVTIERRASQPIMPLRLFSSPRRTGAYLARLLFLGAMAPFWFFTTQFLQSVAAGASVER